jgi:ubiquinone/menaquinone biosynthesis C-methylase UbiE
MSVQKDLFLQSEGDKWFRRNKRVLSTDIHIAACPVLRLITELKPTPARVLEIGCSNGWRLNELKRFGVAECYGIDPSKEAIEDGKTKYPTLNLAVGTADRLPPDIPPFNVVIFGFCLYLCDPFDHFRIVMEADRVLQDDGHLFIHDFDPPMPYRNEYSHRQGMYSYKMDFARLFLAHPHYALRQKKFVPHNPEKGFSPNNRVAVSWLVKDSGQAWPKNLW